MATGVADGVSVGTAVGEVVGVISTVGVLVGAWVGAAVGSPVGVGDLVEEISVVSVGTADGILGVPPQPTICVRQSEIIISAMEICFFMIASILSR